jgi:hypothetical protein
MVGWCSELHENFPIVPEPIRDYIDEVKLHLQHIASAESYDIKHRLEFLRETRHAFGRTALVLSGGGALGAFHIVSLRSKILFLISPDATAPSCWSVVFLAVFGFNMPVFSCRVW